MITHSRGNEMTSEIQILNQNSIIAAFAKKGGINELFDRVAEEVRKEVPDVTTDKGRKAIGSLAAKVSKSKKVVEEAGKGLVAEQKAQIKLIDDDRIAVVKKFEGLYREVLAPRDAWQKEEDNRVLAIEDKISQLKHEFGSFNSTDIQSFIEKIEEIEIDDSFMEFKDKAKLQKYETLEHLNKTLVEALAVESREAEIEKQRIAEQARLQREHEERIAKQAAEQARIEAECKAQAEIEKAEREKREAIEREEKLKHDAEQAVIREKQMKEAAELAAKQAEIDKIKAIEAERLRIELQQKAEAEQKEKLEEQRKANVEHMRQINNDILSSLIAVGLDEDQAKVVIKAIAKNQVPHVTIQY